MIHNCKLIDLPQITDARGGLVYAEVGVHVPFEISRVYYLYDVPSTAKRGGHAHKALHQLIIAASGAFSVVIDDGTRSMEIELARPNVGLYVCPMIWRNIDRFSAGAVCLVLASEKYDESDYYRDYAEFFAAATEKSEK